MHIVDISFHSSHHHLTISEYLEVSEPNIGYAHYLNRNSKITYIFHHNEDKVFSKNGVNYIFKKKQSNSKLKFPFKLVLQIRKLKPDVILVHSLTYVHFAAILKCFLPKKTIVLVQHHGSISTSNWLKSKLIQKCDRYINGYLFTSKKMGSAWVERKLISSYSKVFEVMEGSTSFKPFDKTPSKNEIGVANKIPVFVWVGRLNENKNPLCVLEAFKHFKNSGAHFRLFMFYHTEQLLPEIKQFITQNNLQDHIILKGKIAHEKLVYWYNLADFFVLASYREAGGYALCEAMACGCIPIVTKIPSFEYMVKDGYSGLLFEPGNSANLFEKLTLTKVIDIATCKKQVRTHFYEKLSFKAIAKGIESIIQTLQSKK